MPQTTTRQETHKRAFRQEDDDNRDVAFDENLEREYEELRSSLQCPVCLDTFTRTAKILPCLHTFCGLCIDSVITTTTPVSRSSLTASSSTHSSSSFSFEGAGEGEEAAKHTTDCKEGDDEDEEMLFPCPTCRRYFSLNGEERNLDPIDNALVHSQLDRLDLITAILEHDPDAPCLPPSLPTSSPILSAEGERKRDQLLSLINKVEARKEDIKWTLGMIETMENHILEGALTQSDRIISITEEHATTYPQQFHDMMEIRFQHLHILELSSRKKLDSLEQQKKQLERDAECLENSVSVSRSIALNASEAILDAHLPQIVDQLQRLLADESFRTMPSETAVSTFCVKKPISIHRPERCFEMKEIIPNDVQIVSRSFSHPIDFESLSLPLITFGGQGRARGSFERPRRIAVSRNSSNIVVSDSSNNRIQIFKEYGEFENVIGGEAARIVDGPMAPMPRIAPRAVPAMPRDGDGPMPPILPRAVLPIVPRIVPEGPGGRGDAPAPRAAPARPGGGGGGGGGDAPPIVPWVMAVRPGERGGDAPPIVPPIVPRAVPPIVPAGPGGGGGGAPMPPIVRRVAPAGPRDEEEPMPRIVPVGPGGRRGRDGGEGEGRAIFNDPQGVAINADDEIIVCDTGNYRLQRYSMDGRHLQTFGLPVGDEEANHYVAIAIDHHGKMFVCDGAHDRVMVFNCYGRHVRSFGGSGKAAGQFHTPVGIAIDNRNNVIVSDWKNHRIQVFDNQGNFIFAFGSKGTEDGQFSDSTDVAVDHHNNIIVTDFGSHRIQIFDDTGRHRWTFGEEGTEPFQFNGPLGVAVTNRNRIVVSDSRNHRLKIY